MFSFLVSDVFPFAILLFIESLYRLHRALQPGCICGIDNSKQRMLQGGAVLLEFAVAVNLAASWRTLAVREVSMVVICLVALQSCSGYFFSLLLKMGSYYSGLYDYLLTTLGFAIQVDRTLLAGGLAAFAWVFQNSPASANGSALYLWASALFSVCLGYCVGTLATRR